MRYISHRGNLDGKNTECENNPNYIQNALDVGFDVEIDLWVSNNQLCLGHDYGQHPIDFSWIDTRKDKLWIHCKNIEALVFCSDTDFNYFWHQEDDYTLTSKGFIWTYPNKQLKQKCIMVLPEKFVIDLKIDTHDVCYGICSDYVNIIYKKSKTMISVYGSSGFIGSNFCKLYPLECISIPKEDITSKSDDILYLISTTDNYNVYEDPYIDINTNLTKLIEVLEDYRKSGRTGVFNFVSSWFVYGKTTDLPAHENSPCNPTGFYSITKYAAEKMLISYCQTYGIKYRIFRLTNVIGVGDKKVSKKKNALQYMINNLKSNLPIHLYNNGTSIRDFMDVDDVCDAINCCLEKAPLGEIINISNSKPHSIGELITYCKDKMKSTSDIIVVPPTDFHQIVQIDSMWLDNSKLLSYGYVPKTNVFESLDKIMEL